MKDNDSRPVIAVDIDDVLAANAAGFVKFSNERWGLKLTTDDYDEDWVKLWGVPLETAKVWGEEFHRDINIHEYGLIEHAQPVLKHLKQRFGIVLATSRREVLRSRTMAWLDQNFKGLYDEIRFAGMWENPDKMAALKVTKNDVLKAVGAEYLIDDQLKHCLAAAESGVTALLFGDYKWNKTDEPLPEGVVRVGDWQAVKEFFDGRQ